MVWIYWPTSLCGSWCLWIHSSIKEWYSDCIKKWVNVFSIHENVAIYGKFYVFRNRFSTNVKKYYVTMGEIVAEAAVWG